MPPSPRDHFRLSGLGPLGLALALEGPAPRRGSGLGPPRGLGVEVEVGRPRLPEERGAPHYAGLARDARPFAPANFSRDVPGLQPSALGDLPSSNSHKPWGETAASGLRSGLWIPGRRHGGSPQRPGRRACRADGNSEGGKVREEGLLSSLRVNNTCPTPRDAFSSRASLTTERGGHAKGTEHDESRAGEHIVVPQECQLARPAALRGVPPTAKGQPQLHLPLKSRTLGGFSARGVKGLPEMGQSSPLPKLC